MFNKACYHHRTLFISESYEVISFVVVNVFYISCRFVEVEQQPTGMCVALVLGAFRCLCADIGAASVCEPEHVFNAHLQPLLEEAEFIYVEGYFITHSFSTTLKVCI